MAVHELKTWTMYYQETRLGNKPFEVRKNDRGFAVGDFLILREWCPTACEYTGEKTLRVVTYVLEGGKFGLEPDCVAMGTAPVATMEGEKILLKFFEDHQELIKEPTCSSSG